MRYIVGGEYRYEGEFEFETDDLDKALERAGMAIDEGGYADVYDCVEDRVIEV